MFYNWLSGSQECLFVLHCCLKPCIPPNSSSLWSAAWHLLSVSPSVGWLGQCAFLLWHGSLHNILHTSGSADQQLRSWANSKSSSAGRICCPWSVALPLPSPAFVSAAQAEKFFGQRLILTTFIRYCVNGDPRLVSTSGYLSEY